MYGIAVKKARVEKRMSQLELGKIIGKSKQWVCAFEKGNIRLNMDVGVQLANALGLSCDFFYQLSQTKFDKM